MKKLLLALVCVVFLGAFVGCGKLESTDILSVRAISTGQVISIGDTKTMVEKVVGEDVKGITDFKESPGVERWNYWDGPGLFVDYKEDKVIAIRLMDEAKWEICTGVRVGMEKTAVEAAYADSTLKESGLAGGILMAYDANLTPVAFEEYAPYTIRVSFDDDTDLVSVIAIEMN